MAHKTFFVCVDPSWLALKLVVTYSLALDPNAETLRSKDKINHFSYVLTLNF